jgi:hypothetical protein
MMERAEKTSGTISSLDRRLLENHDVTDPFCVTRIKKKTYSGDLFIHFRGNFLQCSGVEVWFDLDGNEIKADPYKTTWNKNRADALAKELTLLGRPARGEYICENRWSDTKTLKEGQTLVLASSPSDIHRSSYRSNYLVIEWVMKGISGNLEKHSFRVDSYGIPGIAEKIKARIDLLQSLMPDTPEEAAAEGEKRALAYAKDRFAIFDMEFSPTKIKMVRNSHGFSFHLTHSILNSLLKEDEAEEIITFRGEDPEDIWKPQVINGRGTGLEEAKLSKEKNRRDILKKNGGLLQTSLAKRVMEIRGNFPLITDHNGNFRKNRFSYPSNPVISGEIFVKSGRIEATVKIKDKVVLKTGIFEIKDEEIPGAVATSLKGKPLRHLIDHEVITDDMIITSVKCENGSISGRYRMGESRFLDNVELE